MKYLRLYGLMVALLLLVVEGCGSVKSKPVGLKIYAPRDDNYPITVFCTRIPQKTFNDSLEDINNVFGDPYSRRNQIPDNITIGRIEVKGAPQWTWNRMIAEAKQKGRKLGGDAVVITRYDYYGTAETEVAASQLYGKRILAIVIRYTDNNH